MRMPRFRLPKRLRLAALVCGWVAAVSALGLGAAGSATAAAAGSAAGTPKPLAACHAVNFHSAIRSSTPPLGGNSR